MRKTVLIIWICVFINTCFNAQIGGLLNKINTKSGKEENVKYSADVLKNYIYYYETLIKSDLLDTETASEKQKVAALLNSDSAKQIYNYVEKNVKKYADNQTVAENYTSAYSKFNSDFENFIISKINEKLKITYNETYEVRENEIFWFKNASIAINCVRKVYTGTTNLDELLKNIETKKSEYAQALIKTKTISCADQLNYYKQIRFSEASNESTCKRGKETLDSDVTENGVYIYYTGELALHLCKIYVDGKEAGTLTKDDIAASNNGNMKPDNGWYKIQLLPGLKEYNSRSIARLGAFIKNYGLHKNSEIVIKHSNNSGKFTYNISKYQNTIADYYTQINNAQLKSVKLTDTKYKNVVIENETIEAYNKFKTTNPQYDDGEVKKVAVAGNNWTVYKTKAGEIDYQQTDAYFILKGKDGKCYEDFRKIRKVYDPKTKAYNPIKLVGGPDKKEISCDLIK
ncbi:MAG: hypothetical protein JNJ41_11160 [Bacteroidia bacterium]|nr:hypothetical protein [Bacteroidia bacterium]